MTAKAPPPTSTGRKTPSEFLQKVLGGSVLVKLNSGTVYKGILQCLDDRMNIALEKAQEFTQDQTLVASYPLALIRGNNAISHSVGVVHKHVNAWRAGFLHMGYVRFVSVFYISSERDEEAE